MAAKSKPNEIQITRIYDAPVKMVWDAWVDPVQVAKWWGPRGFSITTTQKDVRPGGSWTYVMHGPDGVDYPNKTLFHEVEKYSRLVYDHGGNDDRPPLFRVTVNFSENNGKTEMDMTMALATAEAAQQTRVFIKKAGGNSTWDRLAEFLSPTDKFVINQSFAVSLETLFAAWTTPEHMTHWTPPAGFTMKFIQVDVKPGGASFYVMEGPDGAKIYGKAKYLEIQKPNRIVYTQHFTDEQGKMARHPQGPTWPETLLTTVTLTAEDDNHTRVTIEMEVHGQVTDVERKTFDQAKAGLTQGWTGSLDKLEEYFKSTSVGGRR